MKDLVVGKVECLSNSLGDKPRSYIRKQDDFLEWIEGYKKNLQEKLEKAIKDNKSNLALLLTGKIVTCNDIELAYLKLK